MAQDLRELFEQERKRTGPDMLDGHEDRFLEKLEKQLPQRNKRSAMFVWLRASAAVFLLACVGWGGFYAWKNMALGDSNSPELASVLAEENDEPKTNVNKPPLTLSDISPDLKKVETYFISSINVELASLEISEDEKEMVNAYLLKIQDLGKEYENLNKELNTIGVNDMTITALIENLKIRLQLLQRLKKNLNHSKKETHDKNTSSSI